MKNERKSTKAKRIAQVSFQAKIDASHGSTRARSEAREVQNTTIDASWVSRWWQELTHPCKYLKNNNWKTSRSLPSYLIKQ